ncbi:MAG: transcriptional repressor [Lachnospiraceae bacterium]|nr:transcriptional repressor [Lachnospiraceae bacterium]
MAALKHSRQRDLILTFLRGRKDHPSADAIYQNVRESIPRISLGTVYRNLSLLCDLGEIRRVNPGDGREHFDGNALPHDHFHCERCGCLWDLPEGAESKEPETFPMIDGRITSRQTIYYGICSHCLTT